MSVGKVWEPTTPADTETEASLIITADKDSLALNETITISWSSPIAGNYTFTAECDAGVVLSRETADDSVPIPCQQTILLDGETSITLTPLESETETAEVYYVIGLIDRENDDLLLESDSYFIITNPEANQDEENSPISVSSGDTPSTAPQRPQTGSTIIPVYRRPVSDPNGLVDLTASHFAGGYLTDEQNFLKSQTIDNDFRGAIRFIVRNIGTKTSDEWQFAATLPSGRKITSVKQEPLKPNEEATITLGFNPGNSLGLKTAMVKVYSQADYNQNNNHFVWSIPIVD